MFDENDEEIELLLSEKRRLLRTHQDDPLSTAKRTAFVTVRRTVQKRLREMQDAWLSAKADEIQSYEDKHDYKRFNDVAMPKQVNGEQNKAFRRFISYIFCAGDWLDFITAATACSAVRYVSSPLDYRSASGIGIPISREWEWT